MTSARERPSREKKRGRSQREQQARGSSQREQQGGWQSGARIERRAPADVHLGAMLELMSYLEFIFSESAI